MSATECLNCDRPLVCRATVEMDIQRLKTIKTLLNSFNVVDARYAVQAMIDHNDQKLALMQEVTDGMDNSALGANSEDGR